MDAERWAKEGNLCSLHSGKRAAAALYRRFRGCLRNMRERKIERVLKKAALVGILAIS